MDGHASQPASAMIDNLLGRVTSDHQDRVVQGMLASVVHLHALIERLKPTPDEWRRVIGFLTDVGHSADTLRQEWVLLSDVIGASTLVEDLNSVRPMGATPNTLAGPFYRPDVPDMENGSTISRDGIGAPLYVSGQITDLAGLGIGHATVEVWHANSFGVYENQQPDLQPEFNLRGRFTADPSGAFHFTTVCPGGYSLPDDGPVGKLMNRIGVKLRRPAHLHFRVTAPAYQTLTTHIYDRTDPSIGCDALFCVKPEILGDFVPKTIAGSTVHTLDVRFCLADTTPSNLTSAPPAGDNT